MNKTKFISLATAIWLTVICFPNVAAGQEWKSALSTVKKYANKEYDGGDKYKGQLNNGSREGAGLYSWANGAYYFGNWSNGDMTGYGIYLVSEGFTLKNCENCVAYVGNYKADKKSGKGTCYDKAGKLIYYGDFTDDKPTGTYPSTSNLSSYTFKTISYDGGDKYIGELKDGMRHGAGIYVWSGGDVWYGSWENGSRSGSGIYLGYNASWKTQKCDGDDCTQHASSEDDGICRNPDHNHEHSNSSSNNNSYSNSNIISVPCGGCGGTGRSQCYMCSGTGKQLTTVLGGYSYDGFPRYTQAYVNCNYCMGMGTQTCQTCYGTGRFVYTPSTPTTPITPVESYGGGSGGSRGSSGYESEYRTCVSCKGTGSCTMCKGVGSYVIDTYNSTKVQTCSGCGGSGRCRSCHGAGKVR